MRLLIDITDQVFGRLTVTRMADRETWKRVGKPEWVCSCICGNITQKAGAYLRGGSTRSCGCLLVETGRLHILKAQAAATKHGHEKDRQQTTEYGAWAQMKQRCLNPKNAMYRCYGGRGISVCDSWLTFENFLADMGLKPDPALSLDRIDNGGDYEPDNCRWATASQQQVNRRLRSEW